MNGFIREVETVNRVILTCAKSNGTPQMSLFILGPEHRAVHFFLQRSGIFIGLETQHTSCPSVLEKERSRRHRSCSRRTNVFRGWSQNKQLRFRNKPKSYKMLDMTVNICSIKKKWPKVDENCQFLKVHLLHPPPSLIHVTLAWLYSCIRGPQH